MPATTNPFDSNRGCVGNLSQETMAILAIGVTVLLSFIAGWGGLNSKIGDESAALRASIAELRRDMTEADRTLRRERREDVENLRGELRHEIRALVVKIDLINQMLAHLGADVNLYTPASDSRMDDTAGSTERG